MKVRDNKKAKYRGGPSVPMDSIEFEGYEIKVLRHGNTNHVLYRYPRLEDQEPCWGMDLETAKKGILKWKEEGSPDFAGTRFSTLESGTV